MIAKGTPELSFIGEAVTTSFCKGEHPTRNRWILVRSLPRLPVYSEALHRAADFKPSWCPRHCSISSAFCRGVTGSWDNRTRLPTLFLTRGSVSPAPRSAPTGRTVRLLYFRRLFRGSSYELMATTRRLRGSISLANLTHVALSRSFAGNVPVDRPGHPNNTLFFWAFERQGANGTLTAPHDESNTEPWIIWLQGG